MRHESRPAVHRENSWLTIGMGPLIGWESVSGDLMGRGNSVRQVDGVSDTAPAYQVCGSVEGGLRKMTMASACLSV